MTDLGDFGGGAADPDPPRIQKQKPVHTTQTPDHFRQTGFIGHVPEREATGYVRSVVRNDHRFYALEKSRGGAYAISDDALRTLRRENVTVVLVSERDTGDVYEFQLRDFNEAVPEKFLQTTADPQTYCTLDDADCWEDHRPNLYIPRGESVAGEADDD